MVDYDEISYAEIKECIIDARNGLLSPYWQGYAEREFDSLRLPDGSLPKRAELLHIELKHLLLTISQRADDIK